MSAQKKYSVSEEDASTEMQPPNELPSSVGEQGTARVSRGGGGEGERVSREPGDSSSRGAAGGDGGGGDSARGHHSEHGDGGALAEDADGLEGGIRLATPETAGASGPHTAPVMKSITRIADAPEEVLEVPETEKELSGSDEFLWCVPPPRSRQAILIFHVMSPSTIACKRLRLVRTSIK
jgi:hypothetical protein